MRALIQFLLVFVLITICEVTFSKTNSLKERTDFYKNRYALENTFQKLTNNHGDGFEDLYGTRNFRVVLHGVLYRGGANNKFHKDNKRDNMNPLPNDGLTNLCEEGFGNSVYLYSENFETAPKETLCGEGKMANTLHYEQKSGGVKTDADKMLKAIFSNIKNPKGKPWYFHCWNGWHASGLISSYALMQFCDLSNNDAVAYWDLHTDGYNTEPSFEKIRNRIREFTPNPKLRLSLEEQKLVCPNVSIQSAL